MCGIFGEIAHSFAPNFRESFAQQADTLLAHRGPDGGGQFSDEKCLLGHRRLKIVDLSEAAAQPMVSASNRYVIVFNGEIYNYIEIRSKLQSPPGGWRSQGDTEVLLELFAQRGIGGLQDVVGMFAFAIWDKRDRALTLARDRLGKKPLLYARTANGSFRFASEIAPLVADGSVEKVTNSRLLCEYLQYGYISAPRTSFSTVSSLEPGHVLTAKLSGSDIVVRDSEYWRLPDFRPLSANKHDEWQQGFKSILEDAVKIRLRSDVPIGSMLSGGVDSSVVSLVASHHSKTPLRTFTFAIKNEATSEGPWAAEVAIRIGAHHQTVEAEAPSPSSLRQLVEVFGELNGDISALAALSVSKATREHATVALTGNGGDELLFGYTRYYYVQRLAAKAQRLPKLAWGGASRIARSMPEWIKGDTRIAAISGDVASVYQTVCRTFAPRAIPRLFTLPLHAPPYEPIMEAMMERSSAPNNVRMMAADVRTYLPGDTLFTLDRASMHYGLELRCPLLDHRLFEHVLHARPEWILDGEKGKRPLRELYAPELPSAVFQRAKQGFSVPAVQWMKGDAFADEEAAIFSGNSRMGELVDRTEARRLFRAFRAGLHSYAGRLWHLLVLQAWLEHWKPKVA